MKLVIGLLFSLSCMSNLFADGEAVTPEPEASQPVAAVETAKEGTAATGNMKISCTQKNAEREIEVVYKSGSAKVPCEVMYKRENGEAKMIYSANAKAGFCEEKAEEHKNKLVSMNWVCKNL